jgi:hypothetical protein
MVSNWALFCLATDLATFQKIGRFVPNHLVTLPPTSQVGNCNLKKTAAYFAHRSMTKKKRFLCREALLKGKAQYS